MRSETVGNKINFAGITSAISGKLAQCLFGLNFEVTPESLQVKNSWNFICLLVNLIGQKKVITKVTRPDFLFSLIIVT